MTARDSALWDAFARGDAGARDALLAEHLSLVHHVAGQLRRKLGATVSLDELVSSGTIGLANALEAFDPSRGLAFSTFAVPRIRGAILDQLRREDHASRGVRRKARDVSRARATLGQALGRQPTDKELAEHLGVDLDTLWRWQTDAEGAAQLSLDRPVAGEGSNDLAASLIPDGGDSIEDQIDREQQAEILRRALLELKEQERLVLAMYYYENLKLHEIAVVMNLTESRISQIRSKALATLRKRLTPQAA